MLTDVRLLRNMLDWYDLPNCFSDLIYIPRRNLMSHCQVCEIGPKVVIWSCPDLLLTEYIQKHTRENIWNIFGK